VQQGGQNGATRPYHINAVDCVTQCEIVATCERLLDAFLLPVLGQILAGFPFVVLSLHVDYGSQYINHTVAKLSWPALLFDKVMLLRPRQSRLVRRVILGVGRLTDDAFPVFRDRWRPLGQSPA